MWIENFNIRNIYYLTSGGTLVSAEESDDTCPLAARKNRSKTEAKKTKSVVSRRRKNRNTNKTNFNSDSENSDAETQQRSMELVNLAGKLLVHFLFTEM